MLKSVNVQHVLNGFYKVWIACCIFATLLTVVIQLQNYLKNEDLTRLEYKKFHEGEKDLYPSIAFCFTLPLKGEKLQHYGQNITPKAYASFLAGEKRDEEMFKIPYDEVTQNLGEYIMSYGIMTFNYDDIPLFYNNNSNKKNKKPGFREFSVLSHKCVAIDIPFVKRVKIQQFWINLHPSIFIGGKRLDNPSDNLLHENQFIVVTHYRHQLMKSIYTGVRHWPAREEDASKAYVMRFNIRNIEVIERRNKHISPCNDDAFPDVDGEFMKTISRTIGCKPPYLNDSSSLPLCSKHNQLKEAADLIGEFLQGNIDPQKLTRLVPCRSLEKLHYDPQDIPHSEKMVRDFPGMNSTIAMWFDFKEFTYKEAKNVRIMERQDLIGIF